MDPIEPLVQLSSHGQSYWLDDLSRDLIRSGELARRVREEGLRGVTSNPKIFHDAIRSSEAYDADIVQLARKGLDAHEILQQLTLRDVCDACDVLRPVYDATDGIDGFVSLEVSPHLAHDAGASLEEARRLFTAVARPNVYIKIPGTTEGLAAIEDAIAEGVNINITLLFSIERYVQVTDAYQRALERRVVEGHPLERVSSVASFFLSRIDVLVDERLDKLQGEVRRRAPTLKGRTAVANAKLAYQALLSIQENPRWQKLATRGARIQRLLWASTGTKHPDDWDVKYIEPLIGPNTVSTMPYRTAVAFNDHGTVETSVEDGVDAARRTMSDVAAVGVDFADATRQLLEQGITKFIEPYDALLEGVEQRLDRMTTRRTP